MLEAADPTCQIVLRCSAPSSCQEFGTSRSLSHLPLLCGPLLLWRRMLSQIKLFLWKAQLYPTFTPPWSQKHMSHLRGQPDRTTASSSACGPGVWLSSWRGECRGRGYRCGSQQCPFEAVFCGCRRIRTRQITCS